MSAPTTPKPLAADLKAATAAAHEQAEHSPFMSRLGQGEASREDFIAYQEQMYLVYRALEEACRGIEHPLFDPRLERTAALKPDLDKLHGTADWEDALEALPATARYVGRLEELGEAKDFPRLLAHHYVRYLGDLSGGQVIARMMQRHYGIAPEALTFYDFGGVGKLKPYKDSYREQLNNLGLAEDEREALLQEAQKAFLANMDVFVDLGKAA